ncbi:hypothetical protein [Tsukamurella sp. 1534]|uniref:hypothetical protein n=1 Tax=Tsukamurella sp. 1534 TaxID=1151061 RepID=UPI000306CC32|nr:hypothetical protein [Tsukamurella sp. 1534]
MRRGAAAFTAVALLLCACDTGATEPSAISTPSPAPATGSATATPSSAPAPAGPLAGPAHGYSPSPVSSPGAGPGRVLTLPQLRGGDPAVTNRFNSAMRASLAGMPQPSPETSVDDGALPGGHRSGVTRIGAGAIAGRLVVLWYSKGAAHPNQNLGTVVIATGTAQPVTVDDLYRDRAAALDRIRKLLPESDSSKRLDPRDVDDDRILDHWLPTATGLEFYIGVPHAAGDFVSVLVPWDRIADLLRPGVLDLLRAD